METENILFKQGEKAILELVLTLKNKGILDSNFAIGRNETGNQTPVSSLSLRRVLV